MAALAAAAGALALGGVYGKGWSDRGAHETARQAAILAERRIDAARIIGLTEALARRTAERDNLAKELENAALVDDDAGRVALPARSLQRIDRR